MNPFRPSVARIYDGFLGGSHYYEGDGAVEVMREYIDVLAPSSFVALAHFYDPELEELTAVAERIEEILVSGPLGAGRFRPKVETGAMTPGLELPAPNGTSALSVADAWLAGRPAADSAERLGPVRGRRRRPQAVIGLPPGFPVGPERPGSGVPVEPEKSSDGHVENRGPAPSLLRT